jgi:hypothetical protein
MSNHPEIVSTVFVSFLFHDVWTTEIETKTNVLFQFLPSTHHVMQFHLIFISLLYDGFRGRVAKPGINVPVYSD